jgi:Methyltransferase domain
MQRDVNVKYLHLNILTDELPFEDGYFDYVHIRGLAAGIPENCWLGDHKTASGILDKAMRVLRIGGYFEVMERNLLLGSMLIK